MDESQAYFDYVGRQMAINEANDAVRLYLHTGDGHYIWLAFLAMYELDEPIPQNLIDKFAHIGKKILCAQTDEEVMQALEFKGHPKKHIGPAISQRMERRWRLAGDVDLVKQHFEIGITEAIALTAKEFKLSVAKVKRDYYAVRLLTSTPAEESAQPRRLTKKLKAQKWNNEPWGNRPKY